MFLFRRTLSMEVVTNWENLLVSLFLSSASSISQLLVQMPCTSNCKYSRSCMRIFEIGSDPHMPTPGSIIATWHDSQFNLMNSNIINFRFLCPSLFLPENKTNSQIFILIIIIIIIIIQFNLIEFLHPNVFVLNNKMQRGLTKKTTTTNLI